MPRDKTKRCIGLRALVISGTLALAALAIVAAAALVATSLHYRREVAWLTHAMEDLRVVEELQVNLLVHQREASLLGHGGAELHAETQERAERTLARWLAEARRHALGGHEAAMLANIERALDRYWAGHEHTPAEELTAHAFRRAEKPLEAALAATRAFADHHHRKARATTVRARHLAAIWLWMSAGVGAALVLVVGLALLLSHRRLFLPLRRIRESIGGEAERDQAAPEVGVRELREIARAYNDKRARLAEQARLRKTALAAVAHDLRNPLAALKASAEIVRAAVPAPAEGDAGRGLAVVDRQVDRLNRMVGDLLDAAKIDAGELALQCRTQDIRLLVRNVVELYRPLSPEHELRLELPDAPVPVRCDGDRLEQLVGNLVSNAIKYTPSGPIEVSVTTLGDEAVISVSDRGPGIEREAQRCIFDPFCRLDARAVCASGSGLGLFVARRIAEAHGGRLELESQPGRGSTFRLHLPHKPLTSELAIPRVLHPLPSH